MGSSLIVEARGFGAAEIATFNWNEYSFIKVLHIYLKLFYTDSLVKRRDQMVRISKQAEKRSRFPRKHRYPSKKTGPLQDNHLPGGFKKHENAVEGDFAALVFIPKIK